MLELVEIAAGLVLLLVYVALTLFVPLALFGVLVGLVATVAAIPFGALAGAFGERGERRPAPVAAARLLLVGVIPAAVGLAVVLFAMGALVGALGDPSASLAVGARAFVAILASAQDAGMRAWTGLSLEEALERTAAVDGLRPLGAFTALAAAHLYGALRPEVSLAAFRWIFALAVVAVWLAAVGASPLRLVASALRPRRARAERPAHPEADGERRARPTRMAEREERPVRLRLALVTPRVELARAIVARLAMAGFETVASHASLQDLARTEDPAPDVVFIDARTLRWTAEGVTLPGGLLRRSVLVVDGLERPPPDATKYAAVLRSDALPDEYAAAVRLVGAARRDVRTA